MFELVNVMQPISPSMDSLLWLLLPFWASDWQINVISGVHTTHLTMDT